MEEGLQALQENKAEIQAARADAAVQELCSLFPMDSRQCCSGTMLQELREIFPDL